MASAAFSLDRPGPYTAFLHTLQHRNNRQSSFGELMSYEMRFSLVLAGEKLLVLKNVKKP